ncbi:hypothetical protein PROFUN_16563 [Planoprotostelium fungivorum]|uniref:Uncharacterized protein n=1 Tax=Planoprotostelium fungivorum TaxID=1890364 RepID=A0A2P6MQE3_9EUKA|nr:hypothetical protein PROFUN_16563 [Planoprotostelium fungivorum]
MLAFCDQFVNSLQNICKLLCAQSMLCTVAGSVTEIIHDDTWKWRRTRNNYCHQNIFAHEIKAPDSGFRHWLELIPVKEYPHWARSGGRQYKFRCAVKFANEERRRRLTMSNDQKPYDRRTVGPTIPGNSRYQAQPVAEPETTRRFLASHTPTHHSLGATAERAIKAVYRGGTVLEAGWLSFCNDEGLRDQQSDDDSIGSQIIGIGDFQGCSQMNAGIIGIFDWVNIIIFASEMTVYSTNTWERRNCPPWVTNPILLHDAQVHHLLQNKSNMVRFRTGVTETGNNWRRERVAACVNKKILRSLLKCPVLALNYAHRNAKLWPVWAL